MNTRPCRLVRVYVCMYVCTYVQRNGGRGFPPAAATLRPAAPVGKDGTFSGVSKARWPNRGTGERLTRLSVVESVSRSYPRPADGTAPEGPVEAKFVATKDGEETRQEARDVGRRRARQRRFRNAPAPHTRERSAVDQRATALWRRSGVAFRLPGRRNARPGMTRRKRERATQGTKN